MRSRTSDRSERAFLRNGAAARCSRAGTARNRVLHRRDEESYGRAPTFLLATGYEQVRSIAAYLAGRHRRVTPGGTGFTGNGCVQFRTSSLCGNSQLLHTGSCCDVL